MRGFANSLVAVVAACSSVAALCGCIPDDTSARRGGVVVHAKAGVTTMRGALLSDDGYRVDIDHVFVHIGYARLSEEEPTSKRGGCDLVADGTILFDLRAGVVDLVGRRASEGVTCRIGIEHYGYPFVTFGPGISRSLLDELVKDSIANGSLSSSIPNLRIEGSAYAPDGTSKKIRVQFVVSLGESTQFPGGLEQLPWIDSVTVAIPGDNAAHASFDYVIEHLFMATLGQPGPTHVAPWFLADSRGDNDGIITASDLDKLALREIPEADRVGATFPHAETVSLLSYLTVQAQYAWRVVR